MTIHVGQMTLSEVLCVDVMEDLKRMVTGNRSRHDGLVSTRGDATERLGMRETSGLNGDAREENGINRPVPCGHEIKRVAVKEFGVLSD